MDDLCNSSGILVKNNEDIKKKKAPKDAPENFVGKTFNDGKLKVIEIVDFKKFKNITLFKVTCTECSKDPELFPEGYFITAKATLKAGRLPCGCSRSYQWSHDKYLIIVRRIGEEKSFIVHGFAEEFHGQNTKVDCECLIDRNKWTPTLNNIINSNSGCPSCANLKSRESKKTSPLVALEKCIEVCKQNHYKPIGFPNGYNNNMSYFEYECPEHGIQKVSYGVFVNRETKCPSCAEYGYNPNKPGSFYIVKWIKDDHSFIKFGKTNREVIDRVKQQSRKTEYSYEILFQQTWEDGKIANHLEKEVKGRNTFEIGVINKEKFKDGFTETLDIKYLGDLLVFVVDL